MNHDVEVRDAKENEECLKEEWEELARFSSDPEGLAQFGHMNFNMFSTYVPVLHSMKIYMKRQWTENRKGLPDGKKKTEDWTGDPGEVEEQVQSRQEQKSMIQHVGKCLWLERWIQDSMSRLISQAGFLLFISRK